MEKVITQNSRQKSRAQWLQVKWDYLNCDDSFLELAKRHNVSYAAIRVKAHRELWSDIKTKFKHGHKKTVQAICDGFQDQSENLKTPAESKKALSVTEELSDFANVSGDLCQSTAKHEAIASEEFLPRLDMEWGKQRDRLLKLNRTLQLRIEGFLNRNPELAPNEMKDISTVLASTASLAKSLTNRRLMEQRVLIKDRVVAKVEIDSQMNRRSVFSTVAPILDIETDGAQKSDEAVIDVQPQPDQSSDAPVVSG